MAYITRFLSDFNKKCGFQTVALEGEQNFPGEGQKQTVFLKTHKIYYFSQKTYFFSRKQKMCTISAFVICAHWWLKLNHGLNFSSTYKCPNKLELFRNMTINCHTFKKHQAFRNVLLAKLNPGWHRRYCRWSFLHRSHCLRFHHQETWENWGKR